MQCCSGPSGGSSATPPEQPARLLEDVLDKSFPFTSRPVELFVGSLEWHGWMIREESVGLMVTVMIKERSDGKSALFRGSSEMREIGRSAFVGFGCGRTTLKRTASHKSKSQRDPQ